MLYVLLFEVTQQDGCSNANNMRKSLAKVGRYDISSYSSNSKSFNEQSLQTIDNTNSNTRTVQIGIKNYELFEGSRTTAR